MPHSLISSGGVGVNHLSPDEEEDNDICPVCDGDCTCNNRPRPLPALVVSSGGARYVTTPTASTSSSGRVPGVQSLKIKLTVPPSMQNKPRSLAALPKKRHADGPLAASRSGGGNNVPPFHDIGQPQHADHSNTVGRGNKQLSDGLAPKRRGRPSKATIVHCEPSSLSGLDRLARGNEATMSQSQSRLQSRVPLSSGLKGSLVKGKGKRKSNTKASRQVQNSHSETAITKKTASSKKRAYLSGNSEPEPDLDDQSIDTSFDEDNEDDGASSAHFPTFLPADDLVSTASESSESDSDSTGFGSDWSLEAEEESYILAEERRHDRARVRRELLGDEGPKRKDAHNNWVIRPRKRSVGLSDVEMDGDTDEATEDEENEDELDEGEEEDETDGHASRLAYTGVATGWSEEEESSFDADIFFANLSDTSTDGSLSDDDDVAHVSDAGNEEMIDSISSLPRSVDFEVTEAWDGQLVFTNGSTDGRGALDVAFEVTAAQFIASDNTSVSHDSDVEMRGSSSEEGESEFGEDDGDSTEEELVDEKGLPTSRAMKLFRWPTSISTIDPLSTVSPGRSPGPSHRRSVPPSRLSIESPRPADILAGKVFPDVSDDHSQGSSEGSRVGSPRIISSGGVPVMGQFTVGNGTPQRTAVLTGSNKDVPSPFPRLGHKRRNDRSSSCGSFSSKDLRDRTTKLSLYTPSLLPPSDEPSSETAPETGLGEPIPLHDVLDTTFIDSEPEGIVHTTLGNGREHQRHVQSLNRWDHVPVHAFRLTRESTTAGDIPTSPGWTSEPTKSAVPNARSFDKALRSSPLSMLWEDKSSARPTSRRSKAIMDILTSPVLSPNREGDRTPTRSPCQDLNSNRRQEQNHKNRKESRREMKLSKRKGRDPVHQRHYYHQKQHFRHSHHPNMKARSTGSMQRTNFHGSPTTIPALNI
ncbi:hypothetical protein EDD17DRAFT_1754958 [Pisolithus thermaeus]|nr:hypothetical protein EV401DRAFT_1955544 [Pisolithus croceorrhizus]KAI6164434.1 hypothetical protein EDD17DRAFT_1754958 [Pisolithus thermaeus]